MTPLTPSLFTETSATKLVELGHAYREDSTARAWRYSLAGGTTLARGKLAVQATVDAQRIDLSFSVAPAAGAREASVTIGTGAATADFFADGWLVVQDGTGEGRAYPIEGHDAISASTAGVFKLKSAIDTAGATGQANVDLHRNIYAGAVISVADQADLPIGVPTVAITNAEYGWLQTYGPAAVLADEAIVAGGALTIGSSVAGAVELLDAAGEPLVGTVAGVAMIDTEYQMVDLCLKY